MRAIVNCQQCNFKHEVNDDSLRLVLKRCWDLGIDHAYAKRGHAVKTYAGTELKSIQIFSTLTEVALKMCALDGVIPHQTLRRDFGGIIGLD